MTSSYTYQTRNPRAVHNPIASMPLFRPAHTRRDLLPYLRSRLNGSHPRGA